MTEFSNEEPAWSALSCHGTDAATASNKRICLAGHFILVGSQVVLLRVMEIPRWLGFFGDAWSDWLPGKKRAVGSKFQSSYLLAASWVAVDLGVRKDSCLRLGIITVNFECVVTAIIALLSLLFTTHEWTSTLIPKP